MRLSRLVYKDFIMAESECNFCCHRLYDILFYRSIERIMLFSFVWTYVESYPPLCVYNTNISAQASHIVNNALHRMWIMDISTHDLTFSDLRPIGTIWAILDGTFFRPSNYNIDVMDWDGNVRCWRNIWIINHTHTLWKIWSSPWWVKSYNRPTA